jgi:hypothetical protein
MSNYQEKPTDPWFIGFMGRNEKIEKIDPDFQDKYGVQKFHEKHMQIIYDNMHNVTEKQKKYLEEQLNQHKEIINKQPHGGSRRRASKHSKKSRKSRKTKSRKSRKTKSRRH